MKRQLALILAAIVLLVVSCTPQNAAAPAVATPAPAAAKLANPASVFCQERGFRLELRTDASGGQAGICHFPDGSECDEWAFFRGECGPAAGKAAGTTAPASPLPATVQAAAPTAGTTPAPPPTSPAPNTAVPQPATAAAAGAATYTSAALGISFRYLPGQNGQTVKVFEQGDKIYVYPAIMAPTAGQWVQVFPKPAGESLQDAIKRAIMPGYPAQDCQVTKVANPLGGGQVAPNYEFAGIVVRRAPGEDEAAVLPRWRTCPQPYTVVGGIGYFQADALHPDKFLFFSIGQYAILAGKDLAWQETVKFEQR